MKWLTIVFVLLSTICYGQDIVGAEYFWNSDPGVGNASPMSIETGEDITTSSEISTENLESGIHRLGFRTIDENGMWSHTQTIWTIVEDLSIYQIIAAEYWWDDDPGLGQGTAFDITAGFETGGLLNVETEGLEAGRHRVGIRVMNELGIWSHDAITLVIVEDNTVHFIQAAEYFWDTDPGVGNGISLDVATAAELDEEIGINNYGLPLGDHWLHVRVQDEDGNWSHYHRELVTVCETWGAQAGFDVEFDAGSFSMTNTSQYQDSIQWYVDGVPSGSDETFEFTPTEATEVCLEAYNGCGITQFCEVIGIPMLIAITPDVLPNNQLQIAELHGFLFDPLSDVRIEKDGELIEAAAVLFDSSTQLTAYFEFDNETLGLWDVIVTLESGEELILEDGLELSQWTGIETSYGTTMIVYPNPANASVVLELDCAENCNGRLFVSDASGRTIIETQINTPLITLNTGHWAQGMYFINLQTEKSFISTRLLVNH